VFFCAHLAGPCAGGGRRGGRRGCPDVISRGHLHRGIGQGTKKLAAQMSQGIAAALQGRSSVVSLAVADTRTRITCSQHTRRHFHSASIVKVIILGALLRHLRRSTVTCPLSR